MDPSQTWGCEKHNVRQKGQQEQCGGIREVSGFAKTRIDTWAKVGKGTGTE